MIPVSDDVRAVLEDSHGPDETVVSAFYGPDMTVDEVPIDVGSGSITFDADAQVQGRGSLYIAKDGGDSLIPRAKTDPLAPFGQEVSITRHVIMGGTRVGSVPFGRFRITEVPDMQEFFARYPSRDPRNPANDQRLVVGYVAQVDIRDRFEAVVADDFIQATGPKSGNTAWQEIARLSPFPIVQALGDTAVPAATTYSSRWDALNVLAALLGGKLHMTRQGAITVRQANRWMTATEPEFVINGTIQVNRGMSNELFNQVQLTSNVGGNDLVAVARITDESNPLAVSRMGGRTYRDSLPLTSQAALSAAARTTLERVSTRQAERVKFTCLQRPDLELGDFGKINDPVSGGWVTGEIASMTFPLDALQPMTGELIVSESKL